MLSLFFIGRVKTFFQISVLALIYVTVSTCCQEIFEADSANIYKQGLFVLKRTFPTDTIPQYGYSNGYQQRQNLISSQGYFMAPNNDWVSYGPTPANQGGQVSGRINVVCYDPDPNNSQIIYIGASDGGFWKSTDRGSTWICKTKFEASNSIGAIAIDPSSSVNSRIIYVGTGDAEEFNFGLGLLKSTNGGENWTRITSNLPPLTYFNRIAIRPGRSNELLAALSTSAWVKQSPACGLYRSTDYGETWYAVDGLTGLVCTDVCFSPDGDRAYCIGPLNHNHQNEIFMNGIEYRISTNGGVNFSNSLYSSVLKTFGNSRMTVFKNPNNINAPDWLYVITGDSIYISETQFRYDLVIYLSTDDGNSFAEKWRREMSGNTHCYQPWWNLFIKVCPKNYNLVFWGVNDLFKTSDLFVNWSDIGGYVGSMHADLHDLDYCPDPNNSGDIFCVSDGGIYYSSNTGSTWVDRNSNLTLTQFYRMACSPINPDLMFACAQDNGFQKKRLASNIWDDVNPCYVGDYANVCFGSVDPKYLLSRPLFGVANWNFTETVFYSTNSGLNWTPSSGYNDARMFVASFLAHPTQANIFYSCTNKIWRTENYGVSGTYISDYLEEQKHTNIEEMDISNLDPNIMYAYTGSGYELWFWFNSRLYRSSNAGVNWSNLQIEQNPELSDRYITSVKTDPNNNIMKESDVYLTFSGFEDETSTSSRKVFKSTNGGINWVDISGTGSGKIPNVPANDLIIYYSDCNTKNLVVATDLGVYISTNDGNSWQPLGIQLPNVIVTHLDYNRLAQRIYASTFAMGVWGIDVGGPIYVNDKFNIGGNANIDYDIIVCAGGKLSIPNSCTLSFAQGKKIIVLDGGTLLAPNTGPVSFQGQPGATWGGIEFQGNICTATLKNITFSNTNTPVTITGVFATEAQSIDIENCVFNDGPVSINTRGNVTVKNCTFNYSGSYNPLVQGVSSVGSNKITIQDNTINSNTSLTGTAISVVYGTTVSIVNNTIHDAYNGISVSNCDAYIYENTLTHSSPVYSNDGIGVDNCNSPTYSSNSVTGYYVGLKFGNSSPVLLSNSTSNLGSTFGMIAELESSPRMAPLPGNGELIYDAGYNSIITGNKDLGITNLSIPYLDYGQNYFEAGQNDYYIEGDIYDPFFAAYYVRCNNWNVTPTPQKFNVYNYMSPITVVYSCEMQGGGGGLDPIAEPAMESTNPENVLPPQPIIVDRGNGFYDTIQVVSSSVSSSADRILFAQATKQELLGNYTNAVSIFQQLIQSYPHTASSVKALGSILYCFDRNHADSSNYLNLRNQYLTIAQTYITDTALFRAARNLAIKTLVKMKSYPVAITEYENIISQSNDSLEILFSELNIIETYMLMHQQGGDAPSFTGKLTYLKPGNIQDGLRMIREKYHSANKKTNVKVVPKKFKLAQNYPNPFNPITTISYSLPNNTKVEIKVYDILGRLVKELVNEFKQAGVYEIKFDGTNLASGVYFYKIEADKFVDTKKMVLVK